MTFTNEIRLPLHARPEYVLRRAAFVAFTGKPWSNLGLGSAAFRGDWLYMALKLGIYAP